ncbi:hypothetical protein D9611_004450 [Ephemerocybe angulata]|uniref:Uncharacterized protein n=1 Tax=Ephemerocybe angulata TaxID=980116 RepID=A0A8H5BK46_9AGAR|nr:hypothetical protein D9611_004450 [Tulosesus angulatus]
MADNTLGLELNPEQSTPTQDPAQEQPESPTQGSRPKGRPYVNPDRVKTGGTQRDKLSDDALAERMQRIREQNEKIKQRRLAVEADEEAFRKTQDAEKAKQIHNRKIQEDINKARELAAKRKMDKAQSREWDSGKPAATSYGKQRAPRAQPEPANNRPREADSEKAASAPVESEGWATTDTSEAPADWAAEPVATGTIDSSWGVTSTDNTDPAVIDSSWNTADTTATAADNGPPEGSSGQWTRGGSPSGFRARGGGRGRGVRRGRGGKFNANPPITTQPEPQAEA